MKKLFIIFLVFMTLALYASSAPQSKKFETTGRVVGFGGVTVQSNVVLPTTLAGTVNQTLCSSPSWGACSISNAGLTNGSSGVIRVTSPTSYIYACVNTYAVTGQLYHAYISNANSTYDVNVQPSDFYLYFTAPGTLDDEILVWFTPTIPLTTGSYSGIIIITVDFGCSPSQ